MSFQRARLFIVNTFIAAVLLILVIDTLPQSPFAMHIAIRPLLIRLGIHQGAWTLFAPDPDRMNTRLRAEITYRDGERRKWIGPDWRRRSAWETWVGHRRFEWLDHIATQNGAPAWEPWCRYLARSQRPELKDADRGAEVRVIYHEAAVPPADQRPWRSIGEPMEFDEGWVLTIERFE
jgi:hypothetical protein